MYNAHTSNEEYLYEGLLEGKRSQHNKICSSELANHAQALGCISNPPKPETKTNKKPAPLSWHSWRFE